jgi:holo-[acyl-carrier protein] synthase
MIIGVGIDLVEVARVQRMLDEHGTRLLRRLFTEGEREYSLGMARPALHLAVRLAAKEAAFKALSGTEGARGIGWGEIEVQRDTLGRPSVIFHGRAAERARELSVSRCHCSLTHTDANAAAVVVLESAG